MTLEGLRPNPNPEYGSFNGEPLMPPSRKGMTPDQLKQGFPFRYDLWQSLQTGNNPFEIKPEVLHRRLNTLNNLDRYITASMAAGKNRILREKQLSVFKDTKDFLEQGNHEGFVEAPTGFGKTVLFSEVIRATDQRTVVVVPSRILVEQTYQRFKALNPDLDVGRVYSDKKERGRQVTITTYQSLVLANGGVNPDEIDLLVLDEVHQSLTDVRINAVSRFHNAIKLGFTATPEYTKDKRVENLLNNEIHVITLREAVETGLLSSFSVYLAETNVDISNVKVNQNGDFDDKELEKAIDIYSRNKSALDLYTQLTGQDPHLSKAVAYCVSIKHARDVARLFNENGVRAEAVWSNQDVKERNEVIEAYKRGDVRVLTNVNVLTEGFDDPQASLCLNLRPTLSRVVAKQRGGRVLRLDPDNPRKHAVVVDFKDRDESRRNLQVVFSQVAEGAQILNQVDIPVDGNDLTRPRGSGNGDDTGVEDLQPKFDIEGLNVITNSEEVLRVVRELELLTYSLPPNGWMVVGTKGDTGTISGVLNKENQWTAKWAAKVARELEEEREMQEISTEGRREFQSMYIGRDGMVHTFYSPKVIMRLKEITNSYSRAPEGWRVMGDIRVPDSLSYITGKSKKWLLGRLPEVINKLEQEQRKIDTHLDKKEFQGKYISKNANILDHYSPEVVKRLKSLADNEGNPAPGGWMVKKNIAEYLGTHRRRVEALLPIVINQLEQEQEKIPNDERKTFQGEFLDLRNRPATFYSPEVIERLRLLGA